MFQHTAARRRLAGLFCFGFGLLSVSTHSRPKAAGEAQRRSEVEYTEFQHTAARRRLAARLFRWSGRLCFNTQPPEGGWNFLL